MKLFKKALCLTLVIALGIAISGCGLFSKSSDFDPSETSIFIKRNRTIETAEITDFDNSQFETPRYDEDSLRDFVNDAVSSYNQKTVGMAVTSTEDKDVVLPVAVKSLKVENKKAELRLEFANSTHYLDFNGTTDAVPVRSLIIGSVADGINSELDFSGMAAPDGRSASYEEITAEKDWTLVAIKGDIRLQTEGQIRFYSSALRLVDDYTVNVTGEDVGYIIFE